MAHFLLHHRIPPTLIYLAGASETAPSDVAELMDISLDKRTAVPPSPPDWVPDAARACCCVCAAPFKLILKRRHHCRQCGEVVCGPCSRNKKSLPDLGFPSPVRVCSECFSEPIPYSLERHERALCSLALALTELPTSSWSLVLATLIPAESQTGGGAGGGAGAGTLDAASRFVGNVLCGLCMFFSIPTQVYSSPESQVARLLELSVVSQGWGERVLQLIASLDVLSLLPSDQLYDARERELMLHVARILLPLKEWVEAFVVAKGGTGTVSLSMRRELLGIELYDESPRPGAVEAWWAGDAETAMGALLPQVELNRHATTDLMTLVAACRALGEYKLASDTVMDTIEVLSSSYNKHVSRTAPLELCLMAERLAQAHELAGVLLVWRGDGVGGLESAVAAFSLREKHLGRLHPLTVLSGLWVSVLEVANAGVESQLPRELPGELVHGVEYAQQAGPAGVRLSLSLTAVTVRCLVEAKAYGDASALLAGVLESVSVRLPKGGVSVPEYLYLHVLKVYARVQRLVGGAGGGGDSPQVVEREVVELSRRRQVKAGGGEKEDGWLSLLMESHAVYYSLVGEGMAALEAAEVAAEIESSVGLERRLGVAALEVGMVDEAMGWFESVVDGGLDDDVEAFGYLGGEEYGGLAKELVLALYGSRCAVNVWLELEDGERRRDGELARALAGEGRAYVRLGMSAGDGDECVRCLKLGIPLMRLGLGLNHVAVGEAEELLGACLRRLGRVEEAFDCYVAALAVYLGNMGSGGVRVLAGCEGLAELMEEMGMREGAVEVVGFALGVVEDGGVGEGVDAEWEGEEVGRMLGEVRVGRGGDRRVLYAWLCLWMARLGGEGEKRGGGERALVNVVGVGGGGGVEEEFWKVVEELEGGGGGGVGGEVREGVERRARMERELEAV